MWKVLWNLCMVSNLLSLTPSCSLARHRRVLWSKHSLDQRKSSRSKPAFKFGPSFKTFYPVTGQPVAFPLEGWASLCVPRTRPHKKTFRARVGDGTYSAGVLMGTEPSQSDAEVGSKPIEPNLLVM